MRAVKHIGFLLLLFMSMQLSAQTINKVEYFVDTDPGFGKCNWMFRITAAANISNLLIPG